MRESSCRGANDDDDDDRRIPVILLQLLLLLLLLLLLGSLGMSLRVPPVPPNQSCFLPSKPPPPRSKGSHRVQAGLGFPSDERYKAAAEKEYFVPKPGHTGRDNRTKTGGRILTSFILFTSLHHYATSQTPTCNLKHSRATEKL
uniref:Uncharacterized protein n=1 Tax=Anopheles farauti TaxID=69004 RepID=A0A182QBY8_9DIPT